MTKDLFLPTVAEPLASKKRCFHALFYLAWQCKNLMKLRRAYARTVSPCGRVPVSTTPVAIQQGALALYTSSFRQEENRK